MKDFFLLCIKLLFQHNCYLFFCFNVAMNLNHTKHPRSDRQDPVFRRGMVLPSWISVRLELVTRWCACAPLDQERRARGKAIRMEVEEGHSEKDAVPSSALFRPLRHLRLSSLAQAATTLGCVCF